MLFDSPTQIDKQARTQAKKIQVKNATWRLRVSRAMATGTPVSKFIRIGKTKREKDVAA